MNGHTELFSASLTPARARCRSSTGTLTYQIGTRNAGTTLRLAVQCPCTAVVVLLLP